MANISDTRSTRERVGDESLKDVVGRVYISCLWVESTAVWPNYRDRGDWSTIIGNEQPQGDLVTVERAPGRAGTLARTSDHE